MVAVQHKRELIIHRITTEPKNGFREVEKFSARSFTHFSLVLMMFNAVFQIS